MFFFFTRNTSKLSLGLQTCVCEKIFKTFLYHGLDGWILHNLDLDCAPSTEDHLTYISLPLPSLSELIHEDTMLADYGFSRTPRLCSLKNGPN